MKTNPIFRQLTVGLLCFALVSCATDQQRTVTGGTVIGSALGAVFGGALGLGLAALQPNLSKEERTKLVVGAAIAGAAIGGVKGHQWGKRVALKKERYANREDYMIASIKQASQVQHDAARENVVLKRDVAKLRQSEKTLKIQIAQHGANRQQLKSLRTDIGRRQRDVTTKIGIVDDEIIMQRRTANRESSGDPKHAAVLREKVEGLKREKQQMEQNNRDLGAIRNRIST